MTKTMRYKIYYVIFIFFLAISTLNIGVAIYLKDMFFFTVAVLFIMAAFLFLLEMKKINKNPFLD